MNSISTIHQSYNSSQRLACLSYHLERVILIKSYPSFHLNIIQTYQHDIYIYTHVYIYIILPPTFQIIAPFNWLKSPISHIVFFVFYHLRSPINSINLEVPTLPATCSKPQTKTLETQGGSSMIFERISRFRTKTSSLFFSGF